MKIKSPAPVPKLSLTHSAIQPRTPTIGCVSEDFILFKADQTTLSGLSRIEHVIRSLTSAIKKENV